MKFYNLNHQEEDLQIFGTKNAELLLSKTKIISSVVYTNSFLFYFKKTQKLENLKSFQFLQEIKADKNSGQEFAKLNIILDIYIRNLKQYNNDNHEYQLDKYYRQFYIKKDFVLLNKDQILMTLENFIKVLNIKSKFDPSKLSKYIKDQNRILKLNQKILFQSFQDFNKDFNSQIDYGFEDLIEDRIKSSLIILIIYMLINIIALVILQKYLKYNNNIFYLMMKIEKSQIYNLRGYFKELNFQVKISQSYENLYDYYYKPKKKKQKKTQIIDFKVKNKKTCIWIIFSILLLSLQFPMVFIEHNNQNYQTKKIYMQYKYYENLIFYNVYQSMNNWLYVQLVHKFKTNSKKDLKYQDQFQLITKFQEKFIDFKFIESIFFQDQKFIDFYDEYSGNKICELLQEYKFCDYPEFNNVYQTSFQVHLYENYFLSKKFQTMINTEYGWQNLNKNNIFTEQVRDKLFKDIGLQIIFERFAEQEKLQIKNTLHGLISQAKYYFYLNVMISIVIFLLIFLILQLKLRKQSIENSNFIRLIPIEVLLKNQYFKISINKNQYQLI